MSTRLFARFKATLTLKEKTFSAQGYFNVRSLQRVLAARCKILQFILQFIPQMTEALKKTSDELEGTECVTVLSL